jgi:hypothetical protein
MNTADLSKMNLDEICEAFGYAVARAEAERRNVLWFASAGATRKRR